MRGSVLAQEFRASPNFDARREGATPSILLLHYTGMASAAQSLARLCSLEAQVSCHYFVDEEGAVVQLVDEQARAWHAGQSIWKGVRDINSCSIGIEIQNTGHDGNYEDFPQAQMQGVMALCKDILSRYPIAAERVLAHADIAPARKMDPGEKFNWRLLHQHGIGHFVEPEPISGGIFIQRGDKGAAVEALQGLLHLYGYGLSLTGEFDMQTEQVVCAFQRHFRPYRVDGVADQSTIMTLHKLLRSL